MSSTLKLPPDAVCMSGRVGKEVRIIFNNGSVATRFAQDLAKSQHGWKQSDGYMSSRMPTNWPQRRKIEKS